MKKLIAISAIFFAANAHAFLSRGYNIEQLSSVAHAIFLGEVTQISPNSAGYVEVTFLVYESFKGNVPGSYTVRQIDSSKSKHIDIPKINYKLGQKLVMFMTEPSPTTGKSIPVDFQLFDIQTKSNRQSEIDKAIVVNQTFGDKAGKGLFNGLQKSATKQIVTRINPSRGISFKDFRSLIQASVQP